MLILTRKVGESLIIGDDISITTLSIKGNHVRFGINAPRELSIHREEIYAKTQQKTEAANSNDHVETEKICKPTA